MLPTVAEPHTPRFIPITQELRAIRARNKVTDGQIAAAVGCNPSTINKIVNGLQNPSAELAVRIAGYFCVPVNNLFQFTDLDQI